MKKFIFMLMICLIGLAASQKATAQEAFTQTVTNPSGTITNTSTDTMYYSLIAPKYFSMIGVQVDLVRASGTLAGKAYLYGSINGSTYTTNPIDSLTIVNGTTYTGAIKLSEPIFKKYMIRVTGATTVSATASAKILFYVKP